MLNKATMNWTAKTLRNQISKDKVNFDCAVQRGHVWDNYKKSLLIHSMIEGFPIPPLYFAKSENGVYDALDGKQRCTAIKQFIDGEYELNLEIPPVHNENGEEEDITGATFEALPDWCKDAISDYSLLIYYFEDISEDEVRELFFRLNNGKPLTSIELTRVRADSLANFQKLAKHPAIADSVTDKGKARYNDENMAMQMYVMAYEDEPDFSTKAFRPVIEKAVVTDEQMDEMTAALDYVKGFHDSLNMEGLESKETKRVMRKVKARTHLVSLCYLAIEAIKAGIDQDGFNNMAYTFFNTTSTSVSDVYNSTTGSGSARADSVQKRKAVMADLVANYQPEPETETDDSQSDDDVETENDGCVNVESDSGIQE